MTSVASVLPVLLVIGVVACDTEPTGRGQQPSAVPSSSPARTASSTEPTASGPVPANSGSGPRVLSPAELENAHSAELTSDGWIGLVRKAGSDVAAVQPLVLVASRGGAAAERL